MRLIKLRINHHPKEALKRETGLVLSSLRREARLTQEALAELVEFEPNYISEIERGIKLPAFDSFMRLAQALKCPPSQALKKIETRLAKRR